MSARKFLPSSVPPRLIQQFEWVHHGRTSRPEQPHPFVRVLEVWTTTCIVMNFGKSTPSPKCSVLINPANPDLSGVKKFPYFPRGGPVPTQSPQTMHKDWVPPGFVSNWGGMEVGTGMMYPVSVVDGLVHLTGGWKLQAACQWHRWRAQATTGNSSIACCPTGTAVVTHSADDRLLREYDAIVHTAPPFYKYDSEPERKLAQCYQSALAKAFEEKPASSSNYPLRVAVPLLGAGARGFPFSVAVAIAAQEATRWCRGPTHESESVRNGAAFGRQVLAFGLLELDQAESLSRTIESLWQELDCLGTL